MGTSKTSDRLRSGQLASLAGLSVDTLRHYERRGLLPAPRRLANGYRSYPPEAVGRVLLIQRALSVGFDLEELARILRARDRGQPPCREVRAMAEGKLREVERQIESLHAFQETLLRTLADWDRRLKDRKTGEPARLLESIPASTEKGETAPPPAPLLRGARFDRRRAKKENR